MSSLYQACFNPSRSNYKIVFDGNSWVAGSGSTGGLTYPKQTSDLLIAKGKTVTYQNFGVAGQTIDQMQSDVVSQIDSLVSTYDILIGTEIINQWGLNTSQSKETIYTKYKQYFLDRKAAGWKVVCATTPIDQGYYVRANWSIDRAWFISQMLTEFPSLGIFVINIGGDSRMSDWTNTTYYTADKIHPTNTGYAVWAEIAFNFLINA